MNVAIEACANDHRAFKYVPLELISEEFFNVFLHKAVVYKLSGQTKKGFMSLPSLWEGHQEEEKIKNWVTQSRLSMLMAVHLSGLNLQFAGVHTDNNGERLDLRAYEPIVRAAVQQNPQARFHVEASFYDTHRWVEGADGKGQFMRKDMEKETS